MADSFVISSGWLDGIKNAHGNVTSSGQAYAAIGAALDFAVDVSAAVRNGDSWWSPDAWRASAIKDLDDAATQLRKEQSAYAEDSATPVDKSAWGKSAQKAMYVYSLAQITRKGYPPDTDTTDIEDTMLSGLGDVTQAILDAPTAVISYAQNLANTAVSAVGDVGKNAVRSAGGIVGEAATQVKGAVNTLIPWTPILVGVAVLAGAVVLIVWASKAGAIKDIASLKPV